MNLNNVKTFLNQAKAYFMIMFTSSISGISKTEKSRSCYDQRMTPTVNKTLHFNGGKTEDHEGLIT